MIKVNGGIAITFEFCKWKYETLQKTLDNVRKQGRQYERMYSRVEGRAQVWKSLMETTCEHEFPEFEGDVPPENWNCPKCGAVTDDQLFDENLQNCYSCNFYEYESKSPEGELPGVSSCTHEAISEIDFTRIYNGSKLCDCWTGDKFESRRKKKDGSV